MDGLIQDLLSYSRLGRAELELEPVSLQSIAADVLEQIRLDLLERKASVSVEGPLFMVMGHRLTLTQILINLITNAVKFVAPGVHPRVCVTAEAIGPNVRLWVEDNGIGIAPEHQERIFRVFERLNKAEAYPGTGIGLAIVRRAMERMRGRVGVESEVGKGSRFWIELPRSEGSDESHRLHDAAGGGRSQ
jgi:signal transduction histidine kinase